MCWCNKWPLLEVGSIAACGAPFCGEEACLGSTLQGDEPPVDESLPDSVVVFMLQRESVLAKAKLLHLEFTQRQQDRQLRTLRTQLKQVHWQRALVGDVWQCSCMAVVSVSTLALCSRWAKLFRAQLHGTGGSRLALCSRWAELVRAQLHGTGGSRFVFRRQVAQGQFIAGKGYRADWKQWVICLPAFALQPSPAVKF